MPRLLELYSGTGSVGKVARELGWDVVSFDNCPRYKPDFCRDILDFDFSLWPQGHFDLIWASVPCEKFSVAPARGFTALQRAERAEAGCILARRTLEVLQWFQPTWWAIENPLSSALWKQGIFEGPKVKVSYCKYGMKYRKNTIICSNIPFTGKVCKGDCGFIREVVDEAGKKHKYHLEVAKQGVSAHCKDLGVQCTTHRRDDLYVVPRLLIRDILEAAH